MNDKKRFSSMNTKIDLEDLNNLESELNDLSKTTSSNESSKSLSGLSGFGNFQLRDKPQRPGRNPKTGQEIPISARRVVTFHASQKLKAMVDSATRRSSVHAG
jgi:nucleoid DNA-binding protein